MLYRCFCLAILTTVFLSACENDDGTDPGPGLVEPPVDTGVNVDLAQMPLDSLSSYRFFVGDRMSDLETNEGLLEYEPIATLFSDYAKKLRQIWLPAGTTTTRTTDGRILEFPDGAVILKTFYYDNVMPTGQRRIIETRLLYKEAGQWKFAEYVWNDNQTEAVLQLNGGTTLVEFMNDAGEIVTVNYRIPAEAQCLTCHKMGETAIPIGPKPQNLNALYQYPDGSVANQLRKWHEVGYLAEPPATESILTVVDYNDPSQDLEERVRSYLDINCAHCHREGGHCDYRDIRLAYSESATAEALGICVTPQEFLDGNQRFIVTPGNIDKSALYYRLASNQEEVRMPLLGRTIRHEEGLTLIENWINQLEQECD